MNKTIRSLLGIIIIMLAGFGLTANIIHFFDIRRVEAINLKNDNDYKQIENIMSDIKSNINKISSNNTYTKDENTSIKEYINTCYDGISELSIFKDENKKSINDVEKYALIDEILSTRCPAIISSTINTISKYDNNVSKTKDVFASSLLESMLNIDTINKRLYGNYKYSYINTASNKIDKVSKSDMFIILNSVRTQVIDLQYVVNYLTTNGGE